MNTSRINPIDHRRTELIYNFYFADTSPEGAAKREKTIADNLAVVREDFEICIETQKNYESGGYTVFNVEQIDGLPEHYHAKPEPVIDPETRISHAEEFFGNTGADIRHGGNSAHYSRNRDHVQMPVFESFCSPESYYATLALELTHWTRHPLRLDRDFGRKRWGDEGYARCLVPG